MPSVPLPFAAASRQIVPESGVGFGIFFRCVSVAAIASRFLAEYW